MERFDQTRWSARDVARLLSLVESERDYYQDMMEALPVGLAVVSEDLSILAANGAFRRLAGLSPGELAETRLDTLLEIDDLPGIIGKAIGGGPPEWLAAGLPGGPRSLRLGIHGFRSWDGERRELLVAVADPGDLAQPVAVENPRLRELIEGLEPAVWEVDAATGALLYLSPRIEPLLGRPVEHWLGSVNAWAARVHLEDRHWVEACYHAASAGSRSCEYRVLAADGSPRWVRDTYRLVAADQTGPARIQGFTLEITTEKLRRQAEAQSQKADALGRLSSRVVHECNNLLMIVGGYGEELLQGLPEESPLRPDLDQILTASQRLAVLTQQLVSCSRLPAPRPQAFDLNRVVSALAEKLREVLRPQFSLVTHLDGALPPTYADPGQVAEVLTILFARALRAMPEGGTLTIETAGTEIALPTREAAAEGLASGARNLVRVHDSGAPMDTEEQRRLFEPFAHETHSEDLVDVYGLVRQNGGDVWVSSEPGQGTTFTIFLPRAEEGSAVAAAEQPEPVAPTVLIVEDEMGIRELMKKALSREGYRILEASAAEPALKVAAGHAGEIHLLLTDVDLPGMAGPELAARLGAVRPRMKVLFVSGTGDHEALRSPDLPPGTGFLQKPFTLAALLSKITALLGTLPE